MQIDIKTGLQLRAKTPAYDILPDWPPQIKKNIMFPIKLEYIHVLYTAGVPIFST